MLEPHDVPRGERRLRPVTVGFAAAGVGFVVVLAMLKIYHPFLLARHPDRALGQCLTAAVVAFPIGLFIASVKRAGE